MLRLGRVTSLVGRSHTLIVGLVNISRSKKRPVCLIHVLLHATDSSDGLVLFLSSLSNVVLGEGKPHEDNHAYCAEDQDNCSENEIDQ